MTPQILPTVAAMIVVCEVGEAFSVAAVAVAAGAWVACGGWGLVAAAGIVVSLPPRRIVVV